MDLKPLILPLRGSRLLLREDGKTRGKSGMSTTTPPQSKHTGALVLADGTVLLGTGIGKAGHAVGEVCFNTAMTGYQEVLTDPSYMGQIVTFTFPHIGNVGTNDQDLEGFQGPDCAAYGAIFRDVPTPPSNWRQTSTLDQWLAKRGLVALAGVDTRALTARIRDQGMPHGVIAHAPDGQFEFEALLEAAHAWTGIKGQDLAIAATATETYHPAEGRWQSHGYETLPEARHHVVVIDYGAKRNIPRALTALGAKVTVVPAKTSAEAIMALRPDGVVLSNGPGDPAATGTYAGPVIEQFIGENLPVFGICLGHQMLAQVLGCKTVKMLQGHHGANHPVKDLKTGQVEIVSMNHGFAVDQATLPDSVEETHVSLFDGSNCGIALKGRPVFSVQHHPEGAPGPHDSLYMFQRFLDACVEHKTAVMA